MLFSFIVSGKHLREHEIISVGRNTFAMFAKPEIRDDECTKQCASVQRLGNGLSAGTPEHHA